MMKLILHKILVLPLLLCLGFLAASAQNNITVQGRVTAPGSTNGLGGVAVIVQGTASGTTTDDKGMYRLTNVSPNAVLVFSFVGHKPQNIPVNNRSSIDVNLELETASSLGEVVVIGYGTAKKKDLTGAVASVSAVRLQKQNPTSVQDVLRSNVPGLSVGITTSAKPGGSLQIRGKNTLTAGSTPLIVLDGAIYNGAMSDINPQDIETIDVLKDASAAAVYGAKAASGVILISTKRGKSGKPVINFNTNIAVATMGVNQPVYQGEDFVNWRVNVENSTHGFNTKPYQFSDPRKLPPDVSLQQWLSYDASSGDPVTVWLQRLNFKPIEITNYQKGISTNWYDMVFHNALQQNYTLSLSGGSENFNYYWSAGYLNNDGIVVGDKYSTVNSRLKLEGRVNKWLTVGANTQFAVRNESQVPVNWGLIVNNSPYGGMYNDDTTDYRYSPQDDPGAGARNPLSGPKYTDRRKMYYTLNSLVYAKVKLPLGINYQVNFTPQFEWYQYFNHQSSLYQDYASLGGTAERNEHQLYQWQVDNLFTWSKTINRIHHIDATFLVNAEKYQYWSDDMTNNHFNPSDVLGYSGIGSGTTPVISSDDQYSTGAALMGRLFYSLKERYMLTLSMRRDGYSAFGQKHPWATFPAAAFGWAFTEEPFFKANWLDYGKLRLSYGINGNRDIGRYVALSNLTTGKYLEVNTDGTTRLVTQLYVNAMANPDLKWERTAAYNLGLDFTLLHNVLSGSIDVYKSKTKDLLVNRALPVMVGFSNVYTNIGEVDNKGLEINLQSRNITRKNFTWSTAFNFSMNRNKIAHLYGDKVNVLDSSGKIIGQREPDDITNKWFIGHDVNSVWDIKVQGVYQSNEAAQAQKYGQRPGDFKLQDVNGDGKYTNDDRQFLGYTEPRFRWTLRNDFSFLQHFDLSVQIYSLWGHMSSFNQAKNRDGFPDRTNSYVYPYWTPDKPTNDFARIYSSDGGASYSVYRSRSFIRLDNVALAYTFSRSLVQKAGIQDLKIYFNVKNLAVYKHGWQFWDPEWDSSVGPGPTPRTYTLGLNLTL